MMSTLTNGAARSGYIPDDASYGKYTFEVLSSRLRPGCAESSIVSGLLELIDSALSRQQDSWRWSIVKAGLAYDRMQFRKAQNKNADAAKEWDLAWEGGSYGGKPLPGLKDALRSVDWGGKEKLATRSVSPPTAATLPCCRAVATARWHGSAPTLRQPSAG